ncbi:MAG: exodeoxyribonuclease V subunit alpha [Sphingobacteriia bacterium]|nr:exodeoxyribonuclease V subunit alpha [Sphingobacteriia bacterium]NCC40306.1 exodeoxyribonuclease V subunit alpha [Gammaproteobacteria bacterium]
MPTGHSPHIPELLATLRGWVEAEVIRALDLALTRFVAEQSGETDEAVLLAVVLASERNGHGHVCLDLQGVLSNPTLLLGPPREDPQRAARVREELALRLRGLALADWIERLARSPAVCDWLGTQTDDGLSPLVLAGSAAQPLLYLRRYWQYERRIRDGIQARLERPIEVDPVALRNQLDAIFGSNPDSSPDGADWQRIACALAARSAFFIITGGPGTGKTTTVVRLLALLQGLSAATGAPPLRIELAAPTGKAAARLTESIAAQVSHLAGHQASERNIPTQVKTLHRLLGSIPNSRRFRHHGAHPLQADVVVVDEASMVDVELMARLLDALRPDARLILLGDKDQLSSVEAGAVLGDLCQRAARAHYRPAIVDWIATVAGQQIPRTLIDAAGTALDQAVVMLRTSYRFSPHGGIGALAALVNAATPSPPVDRLSAALALFNTDARSPDSGRGRIAAQRLSDPMDQAFKTLLLEGLDGEEGYLRLMRTQAPPQAADRTVLDAWAKRLLLAQKQFQLLTPLRQGVWGGEGLNQRIIELLRGQGVLAIDSVHPAQQRHWFAGRPVLVTRNDYVLNLMNGDIGLTLSVPVSGTRHDTPERVLRVAFPTVDGGVRWVLPSRLQDVETVFAMTVHKSQGSEFSHALLVLPDQPNPVLTRELLYTAITRAKQRFTLLYTNDAVLDAALERRIQRVSGLQLESTPHAESRVI